MRPFPIIGTAKTGTQDVITHGYNGFLFTPNSISSLASFVNLILSNEKLYTEMSINAKKSLSAGCNIVLYCAGNYKESLKLIKEVPYIDQFTAKKTSEFYKFLR